MPGTSAVVGGDRLRQWGMPTKLGQIVLERTALRDGTVVTVEPFLLEGPEDREMLQSIYERLSPETQYHRFLHAVPRLTSTMLHQLVDQVDWINHVALMLVVHIDGQPPEGIGVARMIRYEDRPQEADVAVTVVDEWQGKGAATILLDALMKMRPQGVVRLVTQVADDNAASLAMLKRLGATSVTPAGEEALEVRVELPAETGFFASTG